MIVKKILSKEYILDYIKEKWLENTANQPTDTDGENDDNQPNKNLRSTIACVLAGNMMNMRKWRRFMEWFITGKTYVWIL